MEVTQSKSKLIELFIARPTPTLTIYMLKRASGWRIACGTREKFTQFLVLLINSLSDAHVQLYSGILVRSCAEIGSVGAMKA